MMVVVYSCGSLVRVFVLVVLGYSCLVFDKATAMYFDIGLNIVA